jgi:HK97 family phage prohead protease
MTDTPTSPREVDVLIAPWDTVSRVTRDGYRERLTRGAYAASECVGLPVIDAHHGTAAGIVVAARDTPAGVVGTLRMSDTERGRDLHTLAADGALGASLGFDADGRDVTVDRSGIVTRSRVTPREVSLTPLPAYQTARVLATREAPTMTDPTPATPEASTAPPTGTAVAAPETVRTAPPSAPVVQYATAADLETLAARVDAERAAPPAVASAHPLARYASFGDYVGAVYRGDASPDEIRALADQVTPDNPGVVPPAWLGDVRGIIARARRLIDGTGGALPPGASGLEVAWPFYDGDLAALVGVQAAEKGPITSVKVSLKRGATDLVTYAGGSDIALQLIERSTPAYLDAYMRIMAAAFGVVTEAAFGAALVAGGVKIPGGTPAGFHATIVAAASDVDDATGMAPSVIGIAADVWPSIAGAVDGDGRPLYAPIGASNAPGTPDGPGAVGGISVAGIPAFRVKGLPAGSAVVTNGDAARWVEDGPRTIDAANVGALGRDVAVYGYAAPALFSPAGVVVLEGIAAAAPARSGK